MLLYTHSVPFDFQVNKADEYMHLSLLSLLLLQSPERTRKECFKDRQVRKGDQYQGTRSVTCFFGKWSKLLTRGGAGEKPASSYHKPQRPRNRRHQNADARPMAENRGKVRHTHTTFLAHPGEDWRFGMHSDSREGGWAQWKLGRQALSSE